MSKLQWLCSFLSELIGIEYLFNQTGKVLCDITSCTDDSGELTEESALSPTLIRPNRTMKALLKRRMTRQLLPWMLC